MSLGQKRRSRRVSLSSFPWTNSRRICLTSIDHCFRRVLNAYKVRRVSKRIPKSRGDRDLSRTFDASHGFASGPNGHHRQ